jgi:hypothetical protein
MLETLGFIAFILAVLFVVMGPKPSSKEASSEDDTDKDKNSHSAGK